MKRVLEINKDIFVGNEKLIYKKPERLSKTQVLEVLQSKNVAAIEEALVSLAFFEKDFDFAKNMIYQCTKNKDEGVRGTAILC